MRRTLPGMMAVSVVAAVAFGCAAEYEITRDDAERVVRTLAADEMAGRSAFGTQIAAAADFIAGEFAEAGLDPLPGASSYLQAFRVHGIETTAIDADLDGTSVPTDRIAVALGAEAARWSNGDGNPVVRVGPDDGPGVLIEAMQGAMGQALVLVHQSHEDLFRNVQGLLATPRFALDPEPRPSVALVLVPDLTIDEYDVSVTGAASSPELTNVVGTIPGRRSDEVVLFSAHHDHIGIRPPVDGDSIANGANDDASGTTAVIALAKYFADRPQPERTLMFATFTAEEAGGYGSTYFSNQLDPDQIVAMFNIEMIGKPAVSGPNTAWVTGWDRSDFGTILQRAVEGTPYEFYPDPYPDQNLFYRSDNATLARLGVPAHSISTTPVDVDPDYHQVTDHVETLDLDHMANTIRAIARAAETIVSGTETPTRVAPANLN